MVYVVVDCRCYISWCVIGATHTSTPTGPPEGTSYLINACRCVCARNSTSSSCASRQHPGCPAILVFQLFLAFCPVMLFSLFFLNSYVYFLCFYTVNFAVRIKTRRILPRVSMLTECCCYCQNTMDITQKCRVLQSTIKMSKCLKFVTILFLLFTTILFLLASILSPNDGILLRDLI